MRRLTGWPSSRPVDRRSRGKTNLELATVTQLYPIPPGARLKGHAYPALLTNGDPVRGNNYYFVKLRINDIGCPKSLAGRVNREVPSFDTKIRISGV